MPTQNLLRHPGPQIGRIIGTMWGYLSDGCIDESFKDFLGVIAVFIRKSFCVIGCGRHGYCFGVLLVGWGAGISCSKKSSSSSLPLVGRLPVLLLYHIPAAGSMAQAISSQE